MNTPEALELVAAQLEPHNVQDPVVKAFLEQQLSACESIDDLDERSNFAYVQQAGKSAGLSDVQIAQAQEVMLAEFMRAVGRC